MTSITILIPCYNEAKGIPVLAAALNAELPKIEQDLDVELSLLFVDDGSKDETVNVLKATDFDAPTRLIVLSRNFGKEAALSAGLDAHWSDAVIMMDADLQHPIALIPDMIRKWREGYDVVYAFKSSRNQEGLATRLLSKAFYRLVNYGSRTELPKNAGDYRLLDRRVVAAIGKLPEAQRFMKGLYTWVGFRQIGIPMTVAERSTGRTSFSPIRLLGLAVDGLTSFSIAPIRIMSIAGLLIATLSFLYMAWIILQRLFFEAPFNGFASLAVLIAFFGGTTVLGLGVVGEYVAKALLEAKRRPIYVVADEIELSDG